MLRRGSFKRITALAHANTGKSTKQLLMVKVVEGCFTRLRSRRGVREVGSQIVHRSEVLVLVMIHERCTRGLADGVSHVVWYGNRRSLFLTLRRHSVKMTRRKYRSMRVNALQV